MSLNFSHFLIWSIFLNLARRLLWLVDWTKITSIIFFTTKDVYIRPICCHITTPTYITSRRIYTSSNKENPLKAWLPATPWTKHPCSLGKVWHYLWKTAEQMKLLIRFLLRSAQDNIGLSYPDKRKSSDYHGVTRTTHFGFFQDGSQVTTRWEWNWDFLVFVYNNNVITSYWFGNVNQEEWRQFLLLQRQISECF